MAKPVVVIVDFDPSYVIPLEYRFLEELGDAIDLEVIASPDYLRVFLSSAHDIEALVISEDCYDSSFEMQNVAHLFMLTDAEQPERTRLLKVEYTPKYSSLELIFNKVISMCPDLRRSSGDADGCTVVVFFSPVGGSGCTTAALAVSAALHGLYKRVLYVDAEYVQTFRCFLKDGKSAPNRMARDMTKMLGDPYENMVDYIEHGEIDYLPPLRAGLSAFGVEFSFFGRFIAAARDSGEYDYIIVDTDSVLNEEKTELFSLADKVLVTVTQNRASAYKARRFYDSLDSFDDEKYRFVLNAYRADEENGFSDSSDEASVALSGRVDYLENANRLDAPSLAHESGFEQIAHSL